MRYGKFYFYNSYFERAKEILTPEQMREYLTVLILYGTEIDNEARAELLQSIQDDLVRVMFVMVHRSIDASIKRYERAVSNGKKGGRPHKVTKRQIRYYLLCCVCSPYRIEYEWLGEAFHCSQKTIERNFSYWDYEECLMEWEQRKCDHFWEMNRRRGRYQHNEGSSGDNYPYYAF